MTGRPARRAFSSIIVFAIATVALGVIPSSGRAQQVGAGDLNQQAQQAQQAQLFNSLSPDQQQALMQRLSGGDLSGTSGVLGTLGVGQGVGVQGNSAQSVLLQQMQLQQQRRFQQRLEQNGQADQNSLLNGLPPPPPVFKPGDTVLVEIIPPNQNKPGSSQSAQPQSAQTQSAQTYNPVTGMAQPGVNGINVQRVQEQPQKSLEELQEDEARRIGEMIGAIRLHNPYEIDQNGALNLAGMPPIVIAGLTEELATLRVAAEIAFDKVQVTLTRLPIEKTGKDALKPFGYDLFENSTVGLLPMLNLPVPADYVVGPGDTLQVQLFGALNQSLRLTVSRNGQVNFPQLGPIQVAGQRYSAMQADIEGRVSRQMIGTRASVTMGEVRTINVFVIGDASYPGSYTVSSLATVTTALFAAGGVKPRGSLRAIQVKRQGQTLETFDLYDLLMRGDASRDVTLQSGDVVFIPSVGPTALADGEVQRPAIYELKGEQSVADLIRMAGGMTPEADTSVAALVRVEPDQRRVVVKVNPLAPDAATSALRNGDLLTVSHLRPQLDAGVTIQGYVYRQKYAAWHEGIRLSDVISSQDDLKPDADEHYLLIRRELPPNRHVAVVSADLAAALQTPGSAADVVLLPRDRITVFDKEANRAWVIHPLLNELRGQANLEEPTQIVHIDGQVKVPGEYPLEPGMRVSDLLRAGGGLNPNAYQARAELARYTIENGDQRNTNVLNVDLTALRHGDRSADVLLQPFDRLSIQQISGWDEQEQVQLKGEVRFPGTYAIRPGETLSSVIRRAGGLTPYAFVDGSLFSRTELKIREQEQLDRLAVRLRTEIAEVALMGVRAQQGSAPSAISVGESLLRQLTDAKAIGRLVINLRAVINRKPGSTDDVILRNGDQLLVPKQRQEVMVLGEVQDPTSHLYKPDMSRDDYIGQSGGPTRQADKRRIYVVRADGSVESGTRGWFHSSDTVQIHPGDAIVVPLDTERLPSLTVWTAVTGILYNLAIGAAEVHATLP